MATQTIDICLAPSINSEHAQVLVTVTDPQAADRIVTAIADAQRAGALFQCEGLTVFGRPVDRTAPVVVSLSSEALPPAGDAPVVDGLTPA